MASCPRCRSEVPDKADSCPVCLLDLNDSEAQGEWILLGAIADKFSADFAKEVLTTYEIPAVVISRSGFFGDVGLTFNTFYKPGSSLFEVFTPAEHAEEAVGVLKMALGEKWQQKES